MAPPEGSAPLNPTITWFGSSPSRASRHVPGCTESYETETYTGADDGIVRILVKVPHPIADASCPTMRVEIAVAVDELVEGDVIEAGYSAYRYRLAGDRFELVPESTPGGRTDCSTPSPTLSPCTTEAYLDAIDRGIDGNIFLDGDQLCDGSFLVTGIDTGSGGCPPTENQPSPCARVKSAYFVARDGTWAVVTYGEGLTCADVTEMTEIRFPAALCG